MLHTRRSLRQPVPASTGGRSSACAVGAYRQDNPRASPREPRCVRENSRWMHPCDDAAATGAGAGRSGRSAQRSAPHASVHEAGVHRRTRTRKCMLRTQSDGHEQRSPILALSSQPGGLLLARSSAVRAHSLAHGGTPEAGSDLHAPVTVDHGHHATEKHFRLVSPGFHPSPPACSASLGRPEPGVGGEPAGISRSCDGRSIRSCWTTASRHVARRRPF
jgi:hypothetical protein